MERTRRASCIASWSLLVLVGGASSLFAEGRDVLGKLGVKKGVCVVLDDPRCELALRLAESSEVTLYVQVRNADEREAACRAADAAGVYGTRILVGSGDPTRIHLADNLADALVAAGDPSGITRAEVLRVLRPGAKALLGQEVLTKPVPDGVDDWSHHYHGPDNNVQSNDRLARAPYLTQFIAEPHYAPAPQNVVASGGRIFMAFGHVAWKERAEPWLDTLVAVNGFNGTMLWKRELTSGIMVDRSTMIATPTTLYLADDKSCKLIDPATGQITGQITVPADLTGGTFWKWMALEDGVLYALVGEQEALDRVARWRRTAGGWPWNAISDGYNAVDPPSFDLRTWKRTESFDAKDHVWGFSKTLLAINPKTKDVLWCHQEQEPIDSRALCVKNGRVYFSRFGKYVVCLDAKTGQEVWRRTAEKDPDLFEAIGPYCPYEHARTGWRSTIYLRCSAKALYFAGPQIFDVTAISTEDGRHLWTYHAERNPHVLIRDDGVYIIGAGGLNADTHKLDPLTGEVLASYTISRAGCTRATGSADSILFRGGGDGTMRLDPASGKMQWISPMRPSCFGGTLVAGGHLYWVPWACDCNLQMFGLICCGPAGDFQFDQAADELERLQIPGGSSTRVAAFEQSPDDWPTYRADNARTATTRAAVPDSVGLLWTFTPQTAFEATPPVAAGDLVFLSGSDGIVRALDATDGKVRWTAYTGGAVRYPPAVADGRALIGSGDGYAYAFEAATGRLLWRFRAAPIERRIRVYDSLLSTWPVASGVLVHEGVAYCAAGINNYDGTHVYALDAASGKTRWQNSSTGAVGPYAGTGVAVQGDLLLDDGKLYLAGGSAASPAVFDIADGKCLSPGQKGRRGRELHLTVSKNERGETQRRTDVVGQPLYATPENPVFERNKRLEWSIPIVQAKNANLSCRQSQGGWKLVAQDPAANRDLWEKPLPNEPVRWAVAIDAHGRIFVTLRNGKVLCFGTVSRRDKTS
jgi:outer membrane protein assembly factor BamB